MRRVFLTICAGLLLAGCGGSDERSTATTPAGLTAAGTVPADIAREAEQQQQHQSATTP